MKSATRLHFASGNIWIRWRLSRSATQVCPPSVISATAIDKPPVGSSTPLNCSSGNCWSSNKWVYRPARNSQLILLSLRHQRNRLKTKTLYFRRRSVVLASLYIQSASSARCINSSPVATSSEEPFIFHASDRVRPTDLG